MEIQHQFIPLFPHAEDLDSGLADVNTLVTQLDRQIEDASYSYHLAFEYLAENRYSPNNFKSIRSELNLLFNWIWFVQKISLKQVDRIMMRKFIDFCNDPPEELVAPTSYPYFITDKNTDLMQVNPKWRPFVLRGAGGYIRKTATLKAQLSLLSGFFLFLADVEYAEKNPAAVLLRRLNVNNTRVTESEDGDKALSEVQWQYVTAQVDDLVEEDPNKHQRTKLLFTLLYYLYPRVSEIAARPGFTPLMSNFKKHRSGVWVFSIPQSKGGKSRIIPCPEPVMIALKAYREFLGLSPLPLPDEKIPLFTRHQAGTHGRDAGVLDSQLGIEAIRGIVNDVFDKTANAMEEEWPYEAQELRGFSIHSLRHTGISHAIAQNQPLQTVMKNAGHSDLATLSIYTSVDLR
ncbi:tyrosine-type recombinase/integrase [Motilimonas cestriensis]|uniref:tyrosine-type recombinase/integrase n=1 Tax=Motilimonas cestriensis TaxID=2742685 RepID=UPI003DA61B87